MILRIALSFLLLTAAAAPALALDEEFYRKPLYDKEGVAYDKDYYLKTPGVLTMGLGRWPGMTEGQFLLHVATENALSGCPKLSDIGYEVEIKQGFVEVAIGDFIVDNRTLSGAGQSACVQQAKTPGADIPFDRDDLLARNVKKLHLVSRDFMEQYDLNITPERVILVPTYLEDDRKASGRYKPMKVFNTKNTSMLWFYPENTVILSVPNAKPEHSGVAEAVAQLAEAEGLVPLETVYPEFKSPLVQPHFYYYVDRDGKMAAKGDLARGIPAGRISALKEIRGMQDSETVQNILTVFARAPGMYE